MAVTDRLQPVGPLRGTFSRCVSLLRDPLSTEGSRLLGGRFNPPGQPALYLASTPTLAVAEQMQFAELLGVQCRHSPRLLVSIEIVLTVVLDLTNPDILAVLRFERAELMEDWQAVETAAPAFTQRLGQRAREEGLEGMLYPSRIEPEAANLVIFPENLRVASEIRLVQCEERRLDRRAGLKS